MTEQQAPKSKELTWVRLHMVPQNENHAMPPFVVGILTKETANAYVLMKVLAEIETDDGWEIQPTPNMHFINRTYVWACEVLADPPQYGEFTQLYPGEDTHGGGMG